MGYSGRSVSDEEMSAKRTVSRSSDRTEIVDASITSSLGLFCLWYGLDSWKASSSVENLILVGPLSFAGLLLSVVILLQIALRERHEQTLGGRHRALGLLFSLLTYALVLSQDLGYDSVTAVFVLAVLLIVGERRPRWLVCFPIIFSVLATQLFALIISGSVPLTLPFQLG